MATPLARDGFRLSMPTSLRPGWPIGNCKSPSARAHSRSNARREDASLEIQLHDAGRAPPNAIASPANAEPNQKERFPNAGRSDRGVPPLVDAILNEIEINRLENSEMAETMNRLAADLKRLSAEPLSTADRERLPAKAVESIATDKDWRTMPATDGCRAEVDAVTLARERWPTAKTT
jgi:hypothetical protein